MHRRASALLFLTCSLLGCGSAKGIHYGITVHPTDRSVALADTLQVLLQRQDGRDTTTVQLAIPQPAPPGPWHLDVQSDAWGGSPFDVDVTAAQGAQPIARGSATSMGNAALEVFLVDVDQSTDDLSLADFSLVDAAGFDQLAPVDLAWADLTPLPDLHCPVSTLKTATMADSQIVTGSNLNWGTGTIMNAGGTFFTLVQFDVTALPTTATVLAMRLSFSYVHSTVDCASGVCTSCDSIEMSGPLNLQYLRSDWVEATVSWITPWSAGPAPGDYSNVIATVVHTALSDVQFKVVNAVDLALLNGFWRTGTNKVSFYMSGINGARFIPASRDWTNASSKCAGPVPPPATLEIDYCP